MYIFPIIVGKRVGGSDMDRFSIFFSNLFTLLAYYLEVGDVGSGMDVGNTMFVNCTVRLIVVFFNSILQTSAVFSYVENVTISLWEGPLLIIFLSSYDGILSLGSIRMYLRMLVLLKMTRTLVCKKILLNSPLRPGT